MGYFNYKMDYNDDHYNAMFQSLINKLPNSNEKESIKQLFFEILNNTIDYYEVYLLLGIVKFDESKLLGNKLTIPIIKRINIHFDVVDNTELNAYIFDEIKTKLLKYFKAEELNTTTFSMYIKGIIKADFIMNENFFSINKIEYYEMPSNFNLIRYLILSSRKMLYDNMHSSDLRMATSPLKLILDSKYNDILKRM